MPFVEACGHRGALSHSTSLKGKPSFALSVTLDVFHRKVALSLEVGEVVISPTREGFLNNIH